MSYTTNIERVTLHAYIDYIRELISIPNITGEETQVQNNVTLKLESIGMRVDRWNLDLEELCKHPEYSTEARAAGRGVDYVCCPDGIRPVVFRLERAQI